MEQHTGDEQEQEEGSHPSLFTAKYVTACFHTLAPSVLKNITMGNLTRAFGGIGRTYFICIRENCSKQ